MIVVDVGCCTHDGADSVTALIDRFHPETLYGCDPRPGFENAVYEQDGTRVRVTRDAAWVRTGEIGYDDQGPASRTGHGLPITVPCFDFPEFIAMLGHCDLVVKLDCEGAEYALLERLIADDLDDRITLLLVEWHDHPVEAETRRVSILERLRCPVEEWAL